MVRHERAHYGAGLSSPQPHRRIVHGLVEPKLAQYFFCSKPLEIGAGGFRRNHQRQHAGIGRDNHILAQATLQSQAGNAESPVLVVEMRCPRRYSRIRICPRHAAFPAILDLAVDRSLVGLVEKCVVEGGHNQQRHEVLEHRSAPRYESSLVTYRWSACRPRANQLSCASWPWAMATKLHSRASDASRS